MKATVEFSCSHGAVVFPCHSHRHAVQVIVYLCERACDDSVITATIGDSVYTLGPSLDPDGSVIDSLIAHIVAIEDMESQSSN